MAAAPAGEVPPGSTGKPTGPEMREAIDGPCDMSLPEEKSLEYLKIAFVALGHDPRGLARRLTRHAVAGTGNHLGDADRVLIRSDCDLAGEWQSE